MAVTILFADNDINFLQTRKEFLIQEGWHVIHATSFLEAKRALELPYLNLAILDIRLENDNDAKDATGIELAKAMGKKLPIIMLTGHPSYEYVRNALKPDNYAAVEFIAKEEGGEALVKAVQDVLNNRRIFLIHGHSTDKNQEVADFIECLGLEAVSLENISGFANTVIERFENEANKASFVVAILTGDDEGYPKGKIDQTKLRARQNVIFEIGYFAAKLGRSNIALLYEKGVEVPTDLNGVLYIPIDDVGEWKSKLAENMVAAGIKIPEI